MKMSKLLVVYLSTALLLLTQFSLTQGNKCGGRGSTNKEKQHWNDLKHAGECVPVLKAIPVEIDGYEMMTPNTVLLNRCEIFHGCRMRHCLPKKNVTRVIRVEGLKLNMRGKGKALRAKCMDFRTFEHEGCTCGCSEDMCDLEIQDFDQNMCKCNCKTKLQWDCNSLIRTVGSNNKMFNPNTCECVCLKKEMCAYGEMFDMNMCKCRKSSDMMG